MISKIPLKTKLIIPIFLISAILLFLGGMLISSKYSQILSLEKLNKKIILSSKVSDIIHSLQKERGLSSGYSVKYNGKFKQEVLDQRKITDITIKSFHQHLNTIESKEFKSLIKNMIFRISQLKSIRDQIDKHKLSSGNIIEYYTNLNKSLLDIVININKESFVPNITQNLLAYSHIMIVKEFAGLERAFGINLLLDDGINQKEYVKFTNTIAIEKQNLEMFLRYGSNQIKNYYFKIKQKKIFKDVKRNRDIILYSQKNSYKNIDAKYWYYITTNKIDNYKSIIKFIQGELSKSIKNELNKIKTTFYMVTFLTILSMIIFIFEIIAFLKLAKEEQKLRLIMNKYIVSSMTDLSGRIIDASEAFCNISGYTKDELIGKNHNIIRHPDMPKSAFKELWDTIQSGRAWKGKVKNLKKDGGFYWVYAHIEPLYNDKGKIDSYISVRLDITQSELLAQDLLAKEQENKKNQEMIQQQSRLAQMGEMISMIAHQWRQPLAAISSTSASIKLKSTLNKLDNNTAIKLADNLLSYSHHLSSTIDDFRDFFKSNKHKSNVVYNQLIQDVLNIVEVSIVNKNITLVKNLQSDTVFYTYPNELKQVILNLIKNAEDAVLTKRVQNPTITIQTKDNILTISDNGGGVAKDIMDKIFDPYFSTKKNLNGTGLGLYMSKIIIEDHCSGKLTVENDKKGAVFSIKLGE